MKIIFVILIIVGMVAVITAATVWVIRKMLRDIEHLQEYIKEEKDL